MDLLQMLRLQNIFGGNMGTADTGTIPPQFQAPPDASDTPDTPTISSRPAAGPDTYDPAARMRELFHPSNVMGDRLSKMIESYPTMAEPSRGREILGRIAGGLATVAGLTRGQGNWGGAPDYGAGQFAQDEITGKNKFREDVANWMNKVKPIETAANIERYNNQTERQIATQTVSNELKNRAETDKALNAVKRTALYEAKNNGAKFDFRGPTVMVTRPDGTIYDSGMETGKLTDEEKINLQGKKQIEAIGKRTEGQLQVEGEKDKNLNKRVEERAWSDPVNIADPNNPGQSIAVQVHKVTGEVRPVKFQGQNTSLPGKTAPGTKADQITNQTKTMMEGARMMLPSVPQLRNMAQQLDKAGMFGPVMSRVRELAAKVGTTGSPDEVAQNFEKLANDLTSDPQLNNDALVGEFTTALGLMASGVGRVHGGARGGGSIQMINYLKNLLSAEGSLSMFNGRLNAVESKLKDYAKGPIAPTNDKVDAVLDKLFPRKQ